MSRMLRRALAVAMGLSACVLALALAVSIWLAWWIPSHGARWLEQTLEQQLPINATIGELRYTPWAGLTIEALSAMDRETALPWFRATRLRARIGVLQLLFRQRVAFHFTTTLSIPAETELTASGRYAFHSGRCAIELMTSRLMVDHLAPEIARRVPELKDGTLRLKLSMTWRPHTDLTVTGRLVGTAVKWQREGLRVTSDVIIRGRGTRSLSAPAPWSLDVLIALDHGSIAISSLAYGFDAISGTLHVIDSTLHIDRLQLYDRNGSWQLQGAVLLGANPAVDLFAHADLDLSAMLPVIHPHTERWHPRGQAAVTAICRGPLARWPDLELMVRADVHRASAQPPRLPGLQLEQLSGRVTYDHLPRRLIMESLTGQLNQQPFTLAGQLRLLTPPQADLMIETRVDLALLKPLLPPNAPIDALAGQTSWRASVQGPLDQPRWEGTVDVEDATVALRSLSAPVEHLTGVIRFSPHTVSTEQLAFTLAGQAGFLGGEIASVEAGLHATGHARVGQATLTLDATQQPDRFVIDAAELTLDGSRLAGRGELARSPARPTRFTINGSVHLPDLLHIPWTDLTSLEPWQLDGNADVQLRVIAPFNDWPTASVVGLVRANQLSLHGLPIHHLTAEIGQAERRLWIRSVNATVAGGTFAGEFLIFQPPESPRYLIECDWTRADLAQIVAAVPDWRDRDVRGTISLHASLLGVRRDPDALRGEGWVHASGERLAELPMLDRLFEGVFSALADRLGLSSLHRAQLVEVGGQWQVARRHVSTNDLRLKGVSLGEPMTIDVHGAVGFDKTLDLVVEPELSERLMLKAPNVSALGGTFVRMVDRLEHVRRLVGRHRIVGTLEKPDYRFEFSLDQLLNQLLPPELGELLQSVR